MSQTQNMATVGEIASKLQVPIHRVEYVIRARKIQPQCRAGNARVFTDADVEYIAAELAQINRTRSHFEISRV